MRGVILGLALMALTPLGDLGESMFKRQFGLKDSGTLLRGHGGVFDRVDSWLWAGVIAYYIIVWFFPLLGSIL
jgi:phosphatidate cytidylyltransferase